LLRVTNPISCPEISLPDSAGAFSSCGLRGRLTRQCWLKRSAQIRRPFQELRTGSRNHACGLLNCWQSDSRHPLESCSRIYDRREKPLTEWERFNKVIDGLLAVPYAEVKFFGRDLGL